MSSIGIDMLRPSDITSVRSFSLVPNGDQRATLAGDLGIDGIRKLKFDGEIEPAGARDLILRASLGATVVQPCGVTFVPVVTRIDVKIIRNYLFELILLCY